MERILSSEPIFDGKILGVRVDSVVTSTGHRGTREVVSTRGAAAIVCVDGDEVVLVRQYRHPITQTLLEIPAGIIDDGEDGAQAAARELVEEVGLRPRHLEHLVTYFASPGFTDHRVEIYLTDDVEPARADPDEGEIIEVVRRPVTSIASLLGSGEVSDAKTLIGLAVLLQRS